MPTDFHMIFVFVVTMLAMYSFVRETVPLEVTSVAMLTTLFAAFFGFFPLASDLDPNLLSAQHILAGFANPSLIAVMALLVMGQALIHTMADVSDAVFCSCRGSLCFGGGGWCYSLCYDCQRIREQYTVGGHRHSCCAGFSGRAGSVR